MCIIAICRTRKMTDEEMRGCWHSNRDGAGIAWLTENGKVKYRKGFMSLQSIRSYYSSVDRDVPHILHFRTGTSGERNGKMTHPYIMDEEASLDINYEGYSPVLFHNGIIINWNEYLGLMARERDLIPPPGDWSDTRTLAWISAYLGRIPIQMLADTNKFVVLGPDGIDRFGRGWVEESGITYSGRGYSIYSSTYINLRSRGRYIAGSEGRNSRSLTRRERKERENEEYVRQQQAMMGEELTEEEEREVREQLRTLYEWLGY